MQILAQEGNVRKRAGTLAVGPEVVQKIIKFQRLWRSYQCRKVLKKRLKKMKSKEQIAKELLTSERSYCQHLSFIIKQILIPSKELIDDNQLHTLLFCNLEGIYEMHANFLIKLEQVMKDYNHHKTRLSSIVYEQLFGKDDFKEKYSNYCANYRKSNKISKLLFVNNSGFNALLKKAGMLQSLALESYLIKPMQRLCKYQLLLNNYLRNMEPDHVDYVELQTTIAHVQKLVKQTNEQVQQFLFEEKYRDILYQYQDVLKKIPSSDRKLIFTMDDISLIDLINDQSTVYKQLNLFNDSILLIPLPGSKPIFCPLNIVRDLPNLKYFKNLVQLINLDRYLTIEFKKQKQKMSFLQATKKTTISDKNKNFVEVSILGTEIRQSLFKNFTVYIVEVQFTKDQIKKIYPRFKDLLRVQEVVDRKKIKINLPSLNKQVVFNTTKSKTIEKRKLIIQQFLQKLLNCKECYQATQIFKILNLTINQQGKKTEQELIISLPSSQPVRVLIDVKNATIRNLKQEIVQNLGLIHSSQFQIFELRNKGRRLMHDDERVTPIYENQSGFNFNPFKECVTYIYYRHHYLQPDDEFAYYKDDFMRTQLELSVIKSQILKYRLEEELMITFMCLFALYINLPVQDDAKLSAFIKDICKKQYKVSKEDFRAYYVEVEKKVESEEDQMVTLPFLIIKIISNCPLYRCQQFEVSVHAKSFKAVKAYIPGLQQKIILGIKSGHVILLTAEEKHIMQSFTLDMIQIAEIHPTAIVLQISNIGPALRLNTQNAFEISNLIQIYKAKIISYQ